MFIFVSISNLYSSHLCVYKLLNFPAALLNLSEAKCGAGEKGQRFDVYLSFNNREKTKRAGLEPKNCIRHRVSLRSTRLCLVLSFFVRVSKIYSFM